MVVGSPFLNGPVASFKSTPVAFIPMKSVVEPVVLYPHELGVRAPAEVLELAGMLALLLVILVEPVV